MSWESESALLLTVYGFDLSSLWNVVALSKCISYTLCDACWQVEKLRLISYVALLRLKLVHVMPFGLVSTAKCPSNCQPLYIVVDGFYSEVRYPLGWNQAKGTLQIYTFLCLFICQLFYNLYEVRFKTKKVASLTIHLWMEHSGFNYNIRWEVMCLVHCRIKVG